MKPCPEAVPWKTFLILQTAEETLGMLPAPPQSLPIGDPFEAEDKERAWVVARLWHVNPTAESVGTARERKRERDPCKIFTFVVVVVPRKERRDRHSNEWTDGPTRTRQNIRRHRDGKKG